MGQVYRKNCELCGNWYESWAKRFCSNSCATKWKHRAGKMPYTKWSKLPNKVCPTCKISFKPVRSKDKYCSKTCYYKSISVNKSGVNHPMYRGGKTINAGGYVLLSVGNGKQVYEHRYVMEQSLNRKLNKSEHIHHLNGDKTDNRLQNLIILDPKEHGRTHAVHQWEAGGSLRNR